MDFVLASLAKVNRSLGSTAERHLETRLKQLGLPAGEREFRFCERRWRFDFAWANKKIALEVEGSVFTGGRHTRGMGFIKDIEKYNNAAMQGWRVVRCTPSTLCKVDTFIMIQTLLNL